MHTHIDASQLVVSIATETSNGITHACHESNNVQRKNQQQMLPLRWRGRARCRTHCLCNNANGTQLKYPCISCDDSALQGRSP